MSSFAETHREHLVVVGRMEEDRFIPGWWVTPSPEMIRGWREAADDSGWSVAAEDREGSILARAPATVAKTPLCRTERFAFYLSALLPLPESAAAVVVRNGERELYRRAIPRPSRVTFARPLAKRMRRGRFRVVLRVDGPVPSDGASVVARWEARGADATPLGIVPVTNAAPSLEVNLGDVPGGENCRLVAVYHDGIRAATVSSNRIELPRREARPILVLPFDGMQIGDDGCIPLEADIEGDADGESLEWSIDGHPVGRGRRALARGHASGHHLVTLRCGPNEAHAHIDIVSAAPPAFRENPLTPPWRVLPVIAAGTLIEPDRSKDAPGSSARRATPDRQRSPRRRR